MLHQTALNHFKNNSSAMARAADTTYQGVHGGWGLVVPWHRAWLLHVRTDGKLKVDLKYYDGIEIKEEFRTETYHQKIKKKRKEAEVKKAP